MSSYRQRLSRYREIRSRSSQSDRKSPSETILAQETAEMNDEAYLMINTEEILRLIEDRLLLLHNNESFYSQRDSRQEQFQQYYRLFDNVQEMTQLWNQTQNKWIFLRSAIVNLNGTQLNSGQFKEILFQFKEIDEQFRVTAPFLFPIGLHILLFDLEFPKISFSKSVRRGLGQSGSQSNSLSQLVQSFRSFRIDRWSKNFFSFVFRTS